MTETPAARELAKALLSALPNQTAFGFDVYDVAQALLPFLAEREAAARGEALREARADLSRDAVGFRAGWGSGNREDMAALDALGKALAWLDDRAAALTTGAPDA